jgi:transcriptional regulator with XRE-family HTH domain
MAYLTDADVKELLLQRVERNMTRRALARELGVSETFLYDVLKGDRPVGPRILRKLGYDPTPHYKKAKEGE